MSPTGCVLFSALLLLVTVNGGQKSTPACDEVSSVVILPNDTDNVCFNKIGVDILGHAKKLTIFDFSHVSGETLVGFLNNNGIKTIRGSIIVNNNDLISSLEFKQITTLDATTLQRDWLFINICNNLELSRLVWGDNLKLITNKPVHIRIYNNPQLKTEYLIALKAMLKYNSHQNITTYIQRRQAECEFVHPTNSSKYFTPTKAFLEKCEKMRGDFILEGRAPSGKIELDKDVCLRLVDVDLTNYKITFSGKGVARCKNGLPSEISGNTGLCKDKLNNLAGYFPKNLVKNISIMPHISCAAACDLKDVLDRLMPCLSANGDISAWFTKPLLFYKQKLLESSDDELTISKNVITAVILPVLKQVKNLTITGNEALAVLILPNLTTVENLTITNNPALLFEGLQLPPTLTPKIFEVDCIMRASTIFTDLRNLSLCTTVKGNLILERLPEEVNVTALSHLQMIEGCLIIRNTNLSSLEFLDHVGSTCGTTHLLEDNPNLCPRGWLSGAPVVVDGAHKKRCGASCNRTLFDGCVKAFGGIEISGETPRPDYEDLEIIQGSLTVSGTSLRTLNLPNLDEITGTKGPVLRIVNNHELSLIQMPALETVNLTGKGTGLLIEITGNPTLGNINFLPVTLRDHCLQGDEKICIYDKREQHKKWSFLRWGIILASLGGYLLLMGGCLYVCCRQEKKELRRAQERRRDIAEKLGTPRRRSATPDASFWECPPPSSEAGSSLAQVLSGGGGGGGGGGAGKSEVESKKQTTSDVSLANKEIKKEMSNASTAKNETGNEVTKKTEEEAKKEIKKEIKEEVKKTKGTKKK